MPAKGQQGLWNWGKGTVYFSNRWQGMGVLVEEAEKQGIYLEYEHFQKG
ncbi:hypothetical protein BBR47_47380 [Brevibacillus brevis NBRC 100599]|uniref:Uncharacterized protein n=1 Tax=Brevibacillus brevis (strain 47 / JCM 6285 / NBRC 100599) TaxID=358681 RepID=C0ZKN8_BREBN|nr:hypothetical protein BBR47_47380 [Brevibacillus brevis NBRC 100599]